jgi:hypothetical protein
MLERLFNFIDDGTSINLNRLSDTYNSVQSSADNTSDVNNVPWLIIFNLLWTNNQLSRL